MKTVKGVLVVSAMSIIVVTGAQAADLPVKAKPIEYVKICSLYGVGFYYIPGTDMCIKVGGYVRSQAEWQSNNGLAPGSTNPGDFGVSTITNGLFNRTSDNFAFTGRGVLSVDARNQSEFGTVRGYLRLGGQTVGTGETSSFFVERAFIQFAGLTAGRAQSNFDIFSNTELFTYTNAKTSGDTYNYGVDMFAYTANLGNGLSATIAAETPRYPAGVGDGTTNVFAVNGVTNLDTAGFGMPDVVGNLRLDQNWGYVGVSGALHRVAGQYYGTPNRNFAHPDDKLGWAAEVGGLINLPWGDTIAASFVGTQGAIGYATKAGNWQMFNGGTVGVGWVTDGLFDTNALAGGNGNTQIHLTNAWSVNAGYEHFWNPRWRTSVYGGYTKVWYDGGVTALINSHLPGAAGSIQCGVPVAGSVWPPINVTATGGVGNSCTPDFSFYQVGTRTQWNITKDFYMGVDIFYTHLNTAYKGVGVYGSGTATTVLDDQSALSGIFRTQYNFSPGNEGPRIVFGR